MLPLEEPRCEGHGAGPTGHQLRAEEWRPTIGGYQVSNLGRVMSKRGRVLKPQKGSGGYAVVGVNKTTKSIHRLVAIAFLPREEGRPMVNHKNGRKDDNRAENLEWCSAKENVAHALKTGLTLPFSVLRRRSRGKAKLSPEQVLEIMASTEHPTVLAERYGVVRTAIIHIWAGRTWKHLTRRDTHAAA